MEQGTLRDLVCFLDTQTRASLRTPVVDTFLKAHEPSLDELLFFTRFRRDTYARNMVHRTELYELCVVAWLPGQKAGIHDHAGSRCWMTVLSGELTSQNYEPCDSNARPFRSGLPTVSKAGDRTYMDDDEGLHSIENTGRLPAVSLHLYAAPLTHCRVYDEQLAEFKLVEVHSFPAPLMEPNTAHPLLLE